MRWAHDHPEEYAEIARLPLNHQNAALRDAIGYDPDAIRDQASEGPPDSRSEPPAGGSPPSRSTPAGPTSYIPPCEACGAPVNVRCSPMCETNRGEM